MSDKKKEKKEIKKKIKLNTKKKIIKQVEKIADKYSIESNMSCLMEEAGELIQAVNKYRRALSKDPKMQKTSLSKKEARNKMIEEMADVERYIAAVKYQLKVSEDDIYDSMKPKAIRDTKRLLSTKKVS